MPDLPLRALSHLSSALCLLSLTACWQQQKPFVPATPFAESFKPLEIVSSVAKQEGLDSAITRGGGSCGSGSGGAAGGPTTTHVQCVTTVTFRSPEDAARMTHAVFEKVRQAAEANDYKGGSFSSGTPEDGELHLGYCSEDPSGDGKGFRGCMFLHGYAIETNGNPARPRIDYHFTLDEVRTVQPTAAPTGS